MNLCRFHADIPMLFYGILAGKISLKSMTAFMRNHIHISAGAVEVSENKGGLIQGQIGHIASRSLCLPAQHIKQFIFPHKIKKFLGLRGKFAVHLLAGSQNFFRRSCRFRIAVLKVHLLVNIFQLLQSQTLSSTVMKLFRKGYEILLNLAAESFHLFFPVAVTVHAVIPQLQIVFIAHLFRLCGTIFHQFVV